MSIKLDYCKLVIVVVVATSYKNSFAQSMIIALGREGKSTPVSVVHPLHIANRKDGSMLKEDYKDDIYSQKVEVQYISPFTKEGRSFVLSGLQNIKVDRLVLGFELSEINILGYSDGARVSSIEELGIDPVDLDITNVSNTLMGDSEKRWVDWRKEKMKTLLVELAQTYKKSNPNGKVMILGKVDYYGQQEFNDLRSLQDWLTWAQSGAVDGVFLEGKWLSRYGDADRFADYARRWNELMKPAGHPVMLVPVSGGSSAVPQSNYARDWQILKAKVPTLVQMGLLVEDEKDQKQAELFLSGQPIPVATQVPATGALMPEFLFPDGTGKTVGPQNWVNQNAVEMLLLPSGFKTQSLLQTLEAKTTALKARNAEAVVVAPARLDFPTTLPVLFDSGRELLDLAGKTPILVRIDKAGFVRDWKPIIDAATLSQALEPKLEIPAISVGQPAPDFVMQDTNGQTRHLAELKGKKNLLLTFFPKCFTGGCQNHLTSINTRLEDFDKADTEVWAVSVDPADVQRDFAAMWKFRFPLVPDVGRNLSLLYGAAQNTEQLSERMSVVIDKNGIVRLIDNQVIVGTHGSDILKKMDELKLGK